jgi:hypothetical protein
VDCIITGRAPIASIDHAIHVIRIIEAARESVTVSGHIALEIDDAISLGSLGTAGDGRR